MYCHEHACVTQFCEGTYVNWLVDVQLLQSGLCEFCIKYTKAEGVVIRLSDSDIECGMSSALSFFYKAGDQNIYEHLGIKCIGDLSKVIEEHTMIEEKRQKHKDYCNMVKGLYDRIVFTSKQNENKRALDYDPNEDRNLTSLIAQLEDFEKKVQERIEKVKEFQKIPNREQVTTESNLESKLESALKEHRPREAGPRLVEAFIKEFSRIIECATHYQIEPYVHSS